MSKHDLGPAADLSGARRFQRRKHHVVGWPIAGLIVLGMCGLVMFGVTTSKVGVWPAVAGAIAALLPVGVVFAAIVWIDRWEPEPPSLLLGAFLWGVGGATACSLLLNNSMVSITNALFGAGDHRVFLTGVLGPLVEEAAKALFVLLLWLRRRSEFSGMVDGVVYAALAAAGFAFTENILYFGKALSSGDLGAGAVITLFLVRAVFAPFSHPLFSAMFGIGVGLAARTNSRQLRVAYLLTGFLGAFVLHAVWNTATLLGGQGFVNMYFLIMVPIFFGTLALIIWQRKREQRIVIEQLPKLERAGLIARSEMELLATLAGRQGWLRKVRRSAGRATAKSVRDYQIAVTELAFLQYRAEQGQTTSAARRARRDRIISDLKQARRSAAGTQQAIQTARLKLDELTQVGVKRPEAARPQRPQAQPPQAQPPQAQPPQAQPPRTQPPNPQSPRSGD